MKLFSVLIEEAMEVPFAVDVVALLDSRLREFLCSWYTSKINAISPIEVRAV